MGTKSVSDKMFPKHLIENILKCFKMMGTKTSCKKNYTKTVSEQTFTKHCPQLLFKHIMYTVYETFHDECSKNISSTTFIYSAIL